MANNRGKEFERKFMEDFLKVPGSTIDRLPDIMSGYRSLTGISDFIGYCYPLHFYFECKSILGNTFPLANLTQYEKLTAKVGIKGVRAGVILWFIDHDTVIYVPIQTFMKIKNDNKKSFNIKMLNDNTYPALVLPSIKKRVFLDSDCSVLMQLPEGF